MAIAQVRALKPDVVLMDIRMPRMDGVAATAALTAAGATKPKVIILTSPGSWRATRRPDR
ncbi:MAG TPA: response regulator [Actinomycetales bacterium]|nr:response regulator [Actinomycetales bacterium]